MPVTVRTFAKSGEAAAALSSDRGARYLGGGTLVMRALNEGDISISTVVRASDPALTRIDAAGSRVTIGAGVTFARDPGRARLAFLHAPARSIGGPAVRNMGTVGGNLFAPRPYGDFTVALLALDATVSVQGGLGSRDVPIEEFLQSRERQRRHSCSRSRARSPPAPRRSATARSPASSRRAARSSRSPRTCRSAAAASSAPALRSARWRRRKFAPARPNARWRDARSMRRRSRRGGGAVEGTSPGDNALASAWYRREIVGVHLRRLLPARNRIVMAKTALQFRHNGRDVAIFVDGGTNLLVALRDSDRRHDAEIRLRPGRLRRVQRADRRRTPPLLPDAGRDRGRPVRGNARRDQGRSRPASAAARLMDNFAAQCGYCTPGMLMAAKALLDRNPSPSRAEVVEAISREYLPLHRLRTHHQCRARRRLRRPRPRLKDLPCWNCARTSSPTSATTI